MLVATLLQPTQHIHVHVLEAYSWYTSACY